MMVFQFDYIECLTKNFFVYLKKRAEKIARWEKVFLVSLDLRAMHWRHLDEYNKPINQYLIFYPAQLTEYFRNSDSYMCYYPAIVTQSLITRRVGIGCLENTLLEGISRK